jgi:hypothetical protein
MQFQASYRWYVVDVNDSSNITLWANVLGVTDEVLLAAIDQVGNEVYSVKEYLGTERRQYH